VAIHDVAPATWPECLHLLHAIRAVAEIPISWLVVPRYHCSTQRSPACEAALGRMLEDGHELVLHGYTHLDTEPLPASLRSRIVRTMYTEREGEFSALGAVEARRRIELGLGWFRARGWPVSGFVAPAWLVGPEVWPLLGGYGFTYTTTLARFHLLCPNPESARRQLPAGRAVLAPALVYAARNGAGRALSPHLADLMAALSGQAPLVRLALHPRDARHPALVRHAQGLVERLLQSREPLTKAAFAQRLCTPGYQYGPQAPLMAQRERP
jgi:predicted deacetylase